MRYYKDPFLYWLQGHYHQPGDKILTNKSIFQYLLIFFFVIMSPHLTFSTPLPVIPDENPNLYGMSTPAGSGRNNTGVPTICKVVMLTDTSPTSSGIGGVGVDTDDSDGIVSGDLRYCLTMTKSPKIVIFEVSGTIFLNADIKIGKNLGAEAETKGSYITIAGQTAPSPGITIARRTFVLERNTHDILIQHLRFRAGDDLSGADGKVADFQDCFQDYWSYNGIDTFPTANIVIDHCSFSWGVDENLEIGGRDHTIQNCIISEGLDRGVHPKGRHSKGMQTINYGSNDSNAGAQRLAIIKNLFAHNVDRNPYISGGAALISNNVCFDTGVGVLANEANYKIVKMSVAGNYIYNTDLLSAAMYFVIGSYVGSKIYLGTDNYFYGEIKTNPWPPMGLEDTEERKTLSDPNSDIPELFKTSSASEAIWPTGYEQMSAEEARDYVLKHAGARPADRDPVDNRVINDVKEGLTAIDLIDTVYYSNEDCTAEGEPMECCTGKGTGDCVRNAEAGWPLLAENIRPLDIPENPHQIQESGYTKIEEWLHDFARGVENMPNECVPPKKPQNLQIVNK